MKNITWILKEDCVLTQLYILALWVTQCLTLYQHHTIRAHNINIAKDCLYIFKLLWANTFNASEMISLHHWEKYINLKQYVQVMSPLYVTHILPLTTVVCLWVIEL